MRTCGSCGEDFSSAAYSRTQWGKGVGVSRCSGCVANGDGLDAGVAVPTARDNISTACEVRGSDMESPFASGTFRWVAKGTYTRGARAGQACVIKWFKTGGVMEERFYAADLKVVAKAVELVSGWNAARIVGPPVRVNRPQVWTVTTGPNAGQKILAEPYIAGYRRFNSNSGWTARSSVADSWVAAMQALSHWSYHSTGGQLTLVDLQGGVSVNGAVLTDPVVLSRTAGAYGVTDLAPTGWRPSFRATPVGTTAGRGGRAPVGGPRGGRWCRWRRVPPCAAEAGKPILRSALKVRWGGPIPA